MQHALITVDNDHNNKTNTKKNVDSDFRFTTIKTLIILFIDQLRIVKINTILTKDNISEISLTLKKKAGVKKIKSAIFKRETLF